jgi:hypothetical protein
VAHVPLHARAFQLALKAHGQHVSSGGGGGGGGGGDHTCAAMASIAGLMSSPIHDKPASVITSPLKPLLAVTDVGLHVEGRGLFAYKPAAADVEQQSVLRRIVTLKNATLWQHVGRAHALAAKQQLRAQAGRDIYTSVSSGSASSCRQRSASCVWMSIMREFEVYWTTTCYGVTNAGNSAQHLGCLGLVVEYFWRRGVLGPAHGEIVLGVRVRACVRYSKNSGA